MYAEINGNRLYYEQLGEGNAPAILCFHGAPGLGDHREPRRAFGPLSDRYRVVVYDARGSGDSGVNPPFTHAQWVEDAEALRRHLGLGRVVIAGGSYGGYIAQEYALAYPENVLAMILRDTACHSGHRREARENALRSARAAEIDFAALDRMFAGQMASDEEMKEVWRQIQPLYNVRYDPRAGEERLKTMRFHHQTHNFAFAKNLPGFDLRARLPSIQAPTLVVHGRHDWIVPWRCGEEIAGLIPNARFEIFEHSGHSPQLEEPERFLALVRSFLLEVLA